MKNTDYNGYGGPRMDKETMRRRLEKVIEQELTEKQRLVVRRYYLEQRTIPQIAAEQGVNKSTISRTLQRAENRMRRCFRY